jgi:nitroreductase/Pyruvate/2-oxoacid:ferredoxin oxidoreductase delta subunit
MFMEHMRKVYLPAHPEIWSNPQIVIDGEKCNGCGNCVKTCPTLILEVLQKKARLIEGPPCFGCGACIAVCKQGAITQNGFYNVSQGVFKTMLLHPQDGYPDPPAVEGIEGMTPVEEVIYKRRSNRIYKKDPVPDELLRRVIEAGRFAPSAGNNQPWSFLVINDRKEMDDLIPYVDILFKLVTKMYDLGRKNKAVRAYLSIGGALLPSLLEQRAMRGGLKTIRPYDVFLGAPSLILILGDKRGISDLHLDIGICSQNMVLAAHSLGLATCYLGFLVQACNFNPLLKKKLGIKWPYKPVNAMVLGYPKVEADGFVKRELPRITWHKNGKVWEEMPR